MWSAITVVLLGRLVAQQVDAAYYDTYTGKQITRQRYDELDRLGLVPYCGLEVQECSTDEYRRMDYSCNNLNHPPRGAQMTPYHRMLPPIFGTNGSHPPAKSGQPLPNARAIRVSVIPDGRAENSKFTQLVPNYAVFITGEITTVHDTANYVVLTTTCCLPGGEQDPRCIPIRVADDDVHLRRSSVRCLNLTAVISYQRLGCVPMSVPTERINTAPPMLDLSILYGTTTRSAEGGRERVGGRLRADQLRGREWPPTGAPVCINNEPPLETRCHDVPTASANTLISANLVYIWFYRSHNALARALQTLNPCWDDDQLYYAAREINIAYLVHIFYYELMPVLISPKLLLKNGAIFDTWGHVEDYSEELEPRVSIEYVIGTRWFHILQDGRIKMYTKDGKFYNEMAHTDLLLRTGALAVNGTLEGMSQGSFRQPCAASNYNIDPDMGERVLGRLQFASDVLSSDIMKGREAGLPPYNHYRKFCGLPAANKFKDLLQWMPREQVEALARLYETPEDIEVFVGLMAEEPMPDSAMGPTLACIMIDQMLRWRRADRFWYENTAHPGAFTQDQLYEIRKMTIARLMCDHAEEVEYIQPNAFLLPSHKNQMVECSSLPAPNLAVFRDKRCAKKNEKKWDGYGEYFDYNK